MLSINEYTKSGKGKYLLQHPLLNDPNVYDVSYTITKQTFECIVPLRASLAPTQPKQ